MNVSSVGYVLGAVCQYVGKTQKTEPNGVSFAGSLQEIEESGEERIDAYKRYLERRYGVQVTVQSVGKDKETLERLGKSMSGSDVIIAPNIMEKMATEPETAAYYEQKINYFFNEVIPRETALCSARGLVFEPCGVVIHEDGSVTYICGCSDSPERVAEVNAINKAKREKRAKLRKESMERRQEAVELQKQLTENYYQKQSIAEIVHDHELDAYAALGIIRSQVMTSDAMVYNYITDTFGKSFI